MNSAVREWIDKAEEDYHVAVSLRRVRLYPSPIGRASRLLPRAPNQAALVAIYPFYR